MEIKRVKMTKAPASKIVREVYHRGVCVGQKQPTTRPFYLAALLTRDMGPGRVECVEPSPHFAYAYTCGRED
jgi:hypothetical protein